MEITLGVSKTPYQTPTEYRVFWKEGSRVSIPKTYYTDGLTDAGLTLASMSREASKQGYRVKISNSQLTQRALRASATFGRIGGEPQVDSFLMDYPRFPHLRFKELL